MGFLISFFCKSNPLADSTQRAPLPITHVRIRKQTKILDISVHKEEAIYLKQYSAENNFF